MKKALFLGLSLALCGCKPAITVDISRDYLGSGETFGLCAQSASAITVTLNGAAVSGEPFNDGECQWIQAPQTTEENQVYEYLLSASNNFGTTQKPVAIHVNVPLPAVLNDVDDVQVTIVPATARYVHEATTVSVWQITTPINAPETDLGFIRKFENTASLTIERVNIFSLDALLKPVEGSRFPALPKLNTLILQNSTSLTDISAISDRVLRKLTLSNLPISTLPPISLELTAQHVAVLSLRSMTLTDWTFLDRLYLYSRDPGNYQYTNVVVSTLDTDFADWNSISQVDGAALRQRASGDANLPVAFMDNSPEPSVPCEFVAGLATVFDPVTLPKGCYEYVDPGFTVSDVPFADPALKACFYDQDELVEDVTAVNCESGNITSLAGLEFFTNVFYIGIHTPTNDIPNLEPLRQLTGLQIFAMSGASRELMDISALLELPALYEVVIADSPKVDCAMADLLVQQAGQWIDIFSCREE